VSAPTTTKEVLLALDEVLEWARREGSRVGYFAALYRSVTARVKEGVEADFFDDGPRMEKLDAVFAQRYLEALEGHRAGHGCTESWRRTFEAAERRRPIILQHLLVAINAHINLDLGIAAAQVAPGPALGTLRRDFDRINEILASMVQQVRRNVGDVSPWIGLLDRFGRNRQDRVINFKIRTARSEAWRFASELSAIPQDQWDGAIQVRDVRVAHLARKVLHPGPASTKLAIIRMREARNVAATIDALGRLEPAELDVVEARVREGGGP